MKNIFSNSSDTIYEDMVAADLFLERQKQYYNNKILILTSDQTVLIIACPNLYNAHHDITGNGDGTGIDNYNWDGYISQYNMNNIDYFTSEDFFG